MWTSAVGYTLAFNTLDSNKDPTNGLLVEFRRTWPVSAAT